MDINLAYIAGGKLHLKLHHAPVRIIDSEFGKSVQERMLQIQRRNIFRNRGVMANMMPSAMVKNMEAQAENATPINFTSVCQDSTGRIFYAIQVGDVAGILALDSDLLQEKRLFHGSDFIVRYLNLHPEQNSLTCTTYKKDGTANIAIMPVDGSRPEEITEGDSLDLAPRWIPHLKQALVYQTAGLARDRQGYIIDRAPFRIEKLDFERQDITEVASEAEYDLLAPHITLDSTLYYIRRPYKPQREDFNIWGFLKDILLMPFRLLLAIYQMFNFFTFSFTGKPLMKAGMPQSKDVKPMEVWGEAIDLAKITRQHRKEREISGLVPDSWELIRQNSNGNVDVMAKGVMYFDLTQDGMLIYTNGNAVYTIDQEGNCERLLVDKLIEQLTVVDN